jgi:hypothetical protein
MKVPKVSLSPWELRLNLNENKRQYFGYLYPMAIERANKMLVLSAIFIFNLSKKQQQYKLDNQITKIDLYRQQQN